MEEIAFVSTTGQTDLSSVGLQEDAGSTNPTDGGTESTQSSLSDVKDKRLLSILQNNSSKVVDENRELLVVWNVADLYNTLGENASFAEEQTFDDEGNEIGWEDRETVLYSKKKALKTAVPGGFPPFKATDISSADGANILNNLESYAEKAKNLDFRDNNAFLKNLTKRCGRPSRT